MSLVDIYTPDNGGYVPEQFVYTSLLEVPLDEYDPFFYPDGDNSVLKDYEELRGVPLTDAERVAQAQRNADANLRLMLNKRLIVPLPRVLSLKNPYMRGQDVIALQRALAAAGVRKWGNFTGVFGAGTKKNIQKFQERKGVKRDGIYDLDTHRLLAPRYDQYGAFLMNKVNKEVNKPNARHVIVSYATFGYNQRYKIHYTQSSLRMYGVRNRIRPPRIPFYEDCSSFSTWCYWGANVPDPNGLRYNGWGYTGTLSQHGVRTREPKPGDLAFYGSGTYSHVVVYIGDGRCISHGSERGPVLSDVYYRSDFSHFRAYV